MSRADQHEKDRKALLQKDFVKNNPIFTVDHILEFYEMFVLYADARTKRADLRDILVTAKTLGLHTKYEIIAKALEELAAEHDGEVDFETFIKDLTAKIGNPFDQKGRQAMFKLVDFEDKDELNAEDLKFISKELRFNLSDDEIKEVISNVGGYDADTIPYEKFEKYLAKKVHKRHLEMDLLKGK